MKKTSRNAFLAEKVIGLILRVYATKESDITNRIEMIRKAIQASRNMTANGLQVIRRIDVLVWHNKKYTDSDCGLTAPAMRNEFQKEKDVHISEVQDGDIFCGILNRGVVRQIRKGVDYSIIVSADAFSYMTPKTMSDMIDAACAGAKAIPVAITELTQSILEGRGANTFMMWDNVALMEHGGFDLKAAKPKDDRTAHYMRGWNEEKGDVYYHLAGVEEVIPLARMIETYGQCIAPIMPSCEGVQGYIVPNPATQLELWERHIAKKGTKFERQFALLSSIGVDMSVLKGGVMEQYRRF